MRTLALVLLVAASPAKAPRAAPAPERPTPPPAPLAAEPPRPRDVSLRFAWPRDVEARVTFRRVVGRTGGEERTFTARYVERAARGDAGIRIESSGTRWEGAIPYPAAEIRPAMRASEAVVQRVGLDGAFAGLENVDALRPVLQRIYAEAGLPDEEADEAIARVESAMVDEARDGWNLAVGFWVGAELDYGKAWEKDVDAPLWLLPTVPVRSHVRMEARRRVPCTASERRARCVELTLRSEPDRAALPGLTRAIVGQVAADGAPLPLGEVREVGARSDLTLVTDPETLLPYQVVWRRAARVALEGGDGARDLEAVERSEWSWTYVRRGAPAR